MAYRSNQQLREDIWDYRDRSSSREQENVLRFPRSDEEDFGETALDLVDQAAELFDSMENHAREREAQAHSLCKSLAEKLLQAERQKEAAERAQLETITELNRRLQEATRGLEACREADRVRRRLRHRGGVSRAGRRKPAAQGQSRTRRRRGSHPHPAALNGLSDSSA